MLPETEMCAPNAECTKIYKEFEKTRLKSLIVLMLPRKGPDQWGELVFIEACQRLHGDQCFFKKGVLVCVLVCVGPY